MYQYRITVNDTVGKIVDYLPNDDWKLVGGIYEERGLVATLERRFVTDTSILDYFGGELPKGYLKLKDTVICPWEVFAEMK